VDNESALHNFIVLAICVPKIIKFAGYLMKLWQKQVGSFFWHTVYVLLCLHHICLNELCQIIASIRQQLSQTMQKLLQGLLFSDFCALQLASSRTRELVRLY